MWQPISTPSGPTIRISTTAAVPSIGSSGVLACEAPRPGGPLPTPPLRPLRRLRRQLRHLYGLCRQLRGGPKLLLTLVASSTPGKGEAADPIVARAPAVVVAPAFTQTSLACSVTVMLYIEQTTTYVPYGYVAPASAGGISTSANVGLGGGGGGSYGCTPITSTIGILSTASPIVSVDPFPTVT